MGGGRAEKIGELLVRVGRQGESQNGQHRLRIAPALRRAACRLRQTSQDALGSQQLQQHQQPAQCGRRRAAPLHFKLDRRAIRRDHFLHPAGDAPQGRVADATHSKSSPNRSLKLFLIADRGNPVPLAKQRFALSLDGDLWWTTGRPPLCALGAQPAVTRKPCVTGRNDTRKPAGFRSWTAPEWRTDAAHRS